MNVLHIQHIIYPIDVKPIYKTFALKYNKTKCAKNTEMRWYLST